MSDRPFINGNLLVVRGSRRRSVIDDMPQLKKLPDFPERMTATEVQRPAYGPADF